jgi:hypothetical protein
VDARPDDPRVEIMMRRPVMLLDVLAVVKLDKGTRYSRTFDPETVAIEWRGA